MLAIGERQQKTCNVFVTKRAANEIRLCPDPDLRKGVQGLRGHEEKCRSLRRRPGDRDRPRASGWIRWPRLEWPHGFYGCRRKSAPGGTRRAPGPASAAKTARRFWSITRRPKP